MGACVETPMEQVFGWLGFATSLLIFLVPLQVLYAIRAADYDLADFSILPYLTALPMAAIWTLYNSTFFIGCHESAALVNMIGVGLELIYVCFFMWHAGGCSTRRGRQYIFGLLAALSLVALIAMAAILIPLLSNPTLRGVQLEAYNHAHLSALLGVTANVMTVLMYASPLGVVPAVLRTRSVDFMPWPITVAHGLNAIVWTVWGVLKVDPYIWIANGLGVLLFFIQAAVYVPVACGLLGPPLVADQLADLSLEADDPSSAVSPKKAGGGSPAGSGSHSPACASSLGNIKRVATEQTSLTSILEPAPEDATGRPLRRTQSARPLTRREREAMLTRTEALVYAATPHV